MKLAISSEVHQRPRGEPGGGSDLRAGGFGVLGDVQQQLGVGDAGL